MLGTTYIYLVRTIDMCAQYKNDSPYQNLEDLNILNKKYR